MTDLDLTPREQPAPPKRRRRYRNLALLAVVVVSLGVVLFQALTSARVYFYNVDEAVEQRSELGDRRIRMQGTVVSQPSRDADGAYRFEISHGDVETVVHHVGAEPTDLFEVGIPVVVEGRWDDEEFRSQQILVKHSEEYIEDNPTRVAEG